jgi:hypothetical protein
MKHSKKFEIEEYRRSIQKVRLPILFLLKGFLHWVGKHGFSQYLYSAPYISVIGKYAPCGLPVNWLMDTKQHKWGHPWCFFSIMEIMEKHSHAELLQQMRHGFSMIPQRIRSNQWRGSIFTLQSKRSSPQCSLQRKWNCLLQCLQSPFGWFHTPWSNNKCSCLPRSSKETLGGYMAKLTRMLTIVLLLLHANGQPHSTNATTNFLKLCGWKNSSTSNTHTWFPLLDFHLLPKTKHHTWG